MKVSFPDIKAPRHLRLVFVTAVHSHGTLNDTYLEITASTNAVPRRINHPAVETANIDVNRNLVAPRYPMGASRAKSCRRLTPRCWSKEAASVYEREMPECTLKHHFPRAL